MAVQTLDSNLDINPNFTGDVMEEVESKEIQLDARRRLEEKIEEMRLEKETREFDFDFDID